jgi:hypothetical protein
MKKITTEEFDEILGHGKGSSSPLFNHLIEMKPDDAFILYKTEWHAKYSPTATVNRVSKKYNMSFSWKALPDRSGWAVKRVK